jgi:16S rRNA (guanine966-N2)-methyltransferase
VRIIAGTWRSRALKAPEGDGTRPTADRVREALFSMLTSRIGSFEGLTVVDLFAGSGALALEALSRGAARAVLVERDAAAIRAAEANIRSLGAACEVRRLDATRLPPAPHAFDLVFLDPPYGQGLVPLALASAGAGGWIAPHALVAAEAGRGEKLRVAGFDPVAERAIGKATLHLLRPALPAIP